MKNPEDLQNLGHAILSVSGSNRGVSLLLIGKETQIIEILRIAIKDSPKLREIMAGLKDGEFEGK
jgi:hypothetical protein